MLDFGAVQAAARRLDGVAHRTPVLDSRTLDAMTGAQVLLKAENLQRMGAFKFRGGFNAVSVIDDATRRRGVVAFSSGNHAQAVALAAQLHACPAVIVMPADAPPTKIAATRGYGAEVVLYDRYRDDRAAIAQRLAGERGLALIPPYDHLPVMAGQGTAALELLQDAGPLDALIAPVGGGGLLSGCGVAARALAPAIRIVGAEPAAGDDVRRSLREGRVVALAEVPRTVCDGQQTQAVGLMPFEVLRALQAEVLTVSDDDVIDAMRFAFERLKIVLEPSGACGLAVLMTHRSQFAGQRVGVVLSGGNVDAARFAALLAASPA